MRYYGCAVRRRVRSRDRLAARSGGVHQSVELSARDLYGQTGRGAGRRQFVLAKPAEQTTLPQRSRCSCCISPEFRARRCSYCRAGRTGRARLVADAAGRGVVFTGSTEAARAIARVSLRAAATGATDRRDRRSERHDRRFDRAAGAGGQRRAAFGFRLRRPALLVVAGAVPATGDRRRRYSPMLEGAMRELRCR